MQAVRLLTEPSLTVFLVLQSEQVSHSLCGSKDTLTACGQDKRKIKTATYCVLK